MDRWRTEAFLLLALVGVLVSFPQVSCSVQADGENAQHQQNPEPVERVVGWVGPRRWWDAVRSWREMYVMGSREPAAEGDGGKGEKKGCDNHEPNPAERAMGFAGIKSRWDAVRSWAKLKLMDVRRPIADSKPGERSSSVKDVVKEAVTKSLETSKETAEHAARSAAEVVDEAVIKAKEKVKQTLSSKSTVKHEEEL